MMIEFLEALSTWLGRYGATIGIVLLPVGILGVVIVEQLETWRTRR